MKKSLVLAAVIAATLLAGCDSKPKQIVATTTQQCGVDENGQQICMQVPVQQAGAPVQQVPIQQVPVQPQTVVVQQPSHDSALTGMVAGMAMGHMMSQNNQPQVVYRDRDNYQPRQKVIVNKTTIIQQAPPAQSSISPAPVYQQQKVIANQPRQVVQVPKTMQIQQPKPYVAPKSTSTFKSSSFSSAPKTSTFKPMTSKPSTFKSSSFKK